jgi:hypothetical protein
MSALRGKKIEKCKFHLCSYNATSFLSNVKYLISGKVISKTLLPSLQFTKFPETPPLNDTIESASRWPLSWGPWGSCLGMTVLSTSHCSWILLVLHFFPSPCWSSPEFKIKVCWSNPFSYNNTLPLGIAQAFNYYSINNKAIDLCTIWC